MEIFRVPMREVPVRVLMDSGQVLEGVLFAAAEGPGGRPGRLADRLNDAGEEFLPLRLAGDSLLLGKSGILTVRLLDEESGRLEVPGLEDEPPPTVPVRVGLAGGESLVGRFVIAMPPDRARVVDFLNAAPRFLPLLGDHDVTLVQRRYIHSVRTLVEEGG